MKSLKILIVSAVLVSHSYALSKSDRNLLVGITAGSIIGALYANNLHTDTIYADKRYKKKYKKRHKHTKRCKSKRRKHNHYHSQRHSCKKVDFRHKKRKIRRNHHYSSCDSSYKKRLYRY